MQGKHLSELCHPMIPFIHSFLSSLQTVFCSSSPEIFVIKLVGFCGFEVEQGRRHVRTLVFPDGEFAYRVKRRGL